MAHRARDRQPLLPVLSRHVGDKWHRLRELLDEAQKVDLGEELTALGALWLHASTKDQRHKRPPVHAINRVTGELVKVSREENLAFWQWAVIETLRPAGLRAEELTEPSHLSIRNYRSWNGVPSPVFPVTPICSSAIRSSICADP